MISAKIIAHSKVPSGQELITIQTKAPKFLDAEIEKHRMISSNSSSDRAIPFSKLADSKDYFIPTDVRLNEKGMQGYERLTGVNLYAFSNMLLNMRRFIVSELSNWPEVHKQHLNRYLMAFSYQDKVMTANKDQWDYFIGLRRAKGADPAIQELAVKINLAILQSTPKALYPGEWHLPYVELNDPEYLEYIHSDEPGYEAYSIAWDVAKEVSAARCARVSYSNHDGTDCDVEKDIELAERLLSMHHMTPFEHQATPMREEVMYYEPDFADGVSHMDKNGHYWSGNFKGFIQNRKLIEEDN